MIRGIKIVGIPVSNQDVALKFYTEKLGFKVVTDQPFTPTQRWIELSIPGSGEGNIALFTPAGQEDRIGSFHSLTFWCDDVVATANVLKSRGVDITDPRKEVWGTFAKFKDPDGNEFVFSSR
jgi:catechol 2,3-dioxygenase-like lactoylglutathione lyase family enzyme